jgi:hypothetical protein
MRVTYPAPLILFDLIFLTFSKQVEDCFKEYRLSHVYC